MYTPLLWLYSGRDGVSNHQSHDCLLNRLFRRISKKTSKLRVTGLCAENSPVTGEFPAHKWPVTRKMFPFHDDIMCVTSQLWPHLKGARFREIPLYLFPDNGRGVNPSLVVRAEEALTGDREVRARQTSVGTIHGQSSDGGVVEVQAICTCKAKQ